LKNQSFDIKAALFHKEIIDLSKSMTARLLSNTIGPQIAFVLFDRIDSLREPCDHDTKEIIYERFALLCDDINSALHSFAHNLVQSNKPISTEYQLAIRSKATYALSEKGQRRPWRLACSPHSTTAILSILALDLWIARGQLLHLAHSEILHSPSFPMAADHYAKIQVNADKNRTRNHHGAHAGRRFHPLKQHSSHSPTPSHCRPDR
jgi:hypothetical protein